jgi:hypothetical protein
MKSIVLYLLFISCIFLSCNSNEKNTTDDDLEKLALKSKVKYPENYQVKEYSDSAHRYIETDSAEFRIIKKYFLNNEDLFAIHRINLEQKMDSVAYFRNNKLSYGGLAIYPNNSPIGQRISLDSTVPYIFRDYDTLQHTYWKALEIANENGFKFPHIEAVEVSDEEAKYWGFYRIDNDSTPQTLLVNMHNGKTKELEYNIKTDTNKRAGRLW